MVKELHGLVLHGKGKGRTLGFPTANLSIEAAGDIDYGVYAASVLLRGVWQRAIANVGRHPTLPEGPPTVEVHVIDGAPDLYGMDLPVRLERFLRAEMRFDSPQALQQQVLRDIESVIRSSPFPFRAADNLSDGVIRLALRKTTEADPAHGFVPAYHFDICQAATGIPAGRLSLRVGETPDLYYSGHIGYAVQEDFRGNGYAYRACRLVIPLAKQHRMPLLRITCRPDNIPSRRTIERLGATLREIAIVPEGHPLYKHPHQEECIYELPLE